MSKKTKLEKILLIPDSHIPYENKPDFNLMLKVAKSVGFDRLYTLGDFSDFFKVSFHERTLERRMGFGEEVEATNHRLDQLDATGIPYRHFIAGNHEYRFDRYLAEKAPELAELPGMNVPDMFGLKARGWKYTPYKDDVKVGKLWLTHDEGTAGPLAAIRARGTYEGNVVIGHCHAMTVSYKGNARGESHVGASLGWLGDPKSVDYMHRVKACAWQSGFGVAVMEPNGVVHLQAVPIVKGKCFVFGALYS